MSTYPPRPPATKEMILAAAEEVAAKIDADAATIAQHYHYGMDGYELARKLESRAYWDVDRQAMEELDEVDDIVRRKVREAEKQWVIEHDIKPALPDGTRIWCPVRQKHGVITGTSDYFPACYLAKEEGQADEDTSRWVIKFENAVVAEAAQ